MMHAIRHTFDRFGRSESGVALVEFAIALPLVLVLFAVTIEGGRLFWSYQATAAGVRDAVRYLARAADVDICNTGGTLNGFASTVEDIVRESSSGSGIFPTGITVTSVSPSHVCVAGTYRRSPAPVAQVSATLEVTFPFGDVFTLVGVAALPTITTTVTDQSRIFGT